MQVTWLHVSDFHIRAGDPYDRDIVLRALVASVKKFRERSRAPDLIFATGDIAYSGKPGEYELASAFLDDLVEAAGLERRQLFVIPGNHDVDRDLAIGLARTLESREQADAYFAPLAPKPHLTQKLAAFRVWHNRYFEGIRVLPENSTCGPVELIDIRGLRIGIVPLNTALFCQNNDDHSKLYIGRRCLESALEELHARAADLTVALLHHPLDWLSGFERANVKASLQGNIDVILRGHLHETDVESVVSANGGALHLAAGAAYQTRNWPNRAIYTSVEGKHLTVFPIRYEDEPREVWTADPSLFPFERGNKHRFRIPRLAFQRTKRSPASSPKPVLAAVAHASAGQPEASPRLSLILRARQFPRLACPAYLRRFWLRSPGRPEESDLVLDSL